MNKMYMVITSDDLNPSTLNLFNEYWKKLKQNHPELKVTFYVPVNYREFGGNNDITDSVEFKQWFTENRSWCDVELHGLTHEKPPEFHRGFEEQLSRIGNSINALCDYLDLSCIGFKAPFYRMNEDTVKALSSFNVAWYSQWWNLNLLKPNIRMVPPFIEIGTHTGPSQANNPDNIDIYFDRLDSLLYQLEKEGRKYKTMRDIVKGAIE